MRTQSERPPKYRGWTFVLRIAEERLFGVGDDINSGSMIERREIFRQQLLRLFPGAEIIAEYLPGNGGCSVTPIGPTLTHTIHGDLVVIHRKYPKQAPKFLEAVKKVLDWMPEAQTLLGPGDSNPAVPPVLKETTDVADPPSPSPS